MSDNVSGIWRTVGGRRIFIKEGQDLATAMKESGKFNNKNEIKRKEERIKQIREEKNKIEKNLFGRTKEEEQKLDNLIQENERLQKSILDEKANLDKSYIQDKELRDYIYDYTAGNYKVAVEYTKKLALGKSEEESLDYVKKYCDSKNMSVEDNVRLAKKLQDKINNQSDTSKTLIRFEKTQMNQDFNGNLIDSQKKYNIGDEIKWGIMSTSSDENYIEKIASGNDKIELSSLNSSLPYTYTEYRIIGNKKGLDISKYSEYKDQQEVLVSGNFIVEKVEYFKPIKVYDEKKISFKDYIKENNYTYEIKTSKSGKEIMYFKDKNNNIVYNRDIDSFLRNIDGYYGSTNKLTLEDVLDGKVPYKKEKIENKDKSTYGLERQIVTIKQKK